MFKIITITALLAATTAVPAQARGWLPTPAPVATLAQEKATATSFAPSGKGVVLITAKDRAAQQSWWAMRSQRGAERRMAACVAMPDCTGKRMTSASNG